MQQQLDVELKFYDENESYTLLIDSTGISIINTDGRTVNVNEMFIFRALESIFEMLSVDKVCRL